MQNDAPSASSRPTALSAGVSASQLGKATISHEDMLALVVETLEDAKAQDLVSIELAGKSPLADYMVIASGTSTRQVVTMAEKLVEKLKHDADVIPKLEGVEQGDWALIDDGDVIIHLFRPEVREFYNLERMWTGMEDGAGTALNG